MRSNVLKLSLVSLQSVFCLNSGHLPHLSQQQTSILSRYIAGICPVSTAGPSQHQTSVMSRHARLHMQTSFDHESLYVTVCSRFRVYQSQVALYNFEPWLPQTKRMMKRQSCRKGAGPFKWSRTKRSTSLPKPLMISRKVPILMQR